LKVQLKGKMKRNIRLLTSQMAFLVMLHQSFSKTIGAVPFKALKAKATQFLSIELDGLQGRLNLSIISLAAHQAKVCAQGIEFPEVQYEML